MAQVYEGVAVGDRGFERRVAIKRVLPEHLHNPSMRRMFLDEADADTPTITFAPSAVTIIMALTIPVFVLGIFATPLLNALSNLSFAALGGN